MKTHNILKVILCVVLFVTLCTWIFPTISYKSGLVEETTRTQLGVFDIFAYIVEIFRYFPYVILMTLSIGMFYGVAYKIPAYSELLNAVVSKFRGREKVFLIAVMSIIALVVSVTGLSFGIMFVFPFIISIVLLMGYNKLVAASVTVGSTIVGILGTTLGTNTTYYINTLLSTTAFSEIIAKIVILVLGLVLLIYNVLRYADKTKNNTDKVAELVPSELKAISTSKIVEPVLSENNDEDKNKKKATSSTTKKNASKTTTKQKTSDKSKGKDKTTKSAKTSKTSKRNSKTTAYDLKSKTEVKVVKTKKKTHIWPFALIFDLVFIILAIGTFDWSGVLNVDFFEQALKAVEDFEISGFPIFAKLLGSVKAFGSWTLNYEMPTLIFVATCFLAFIYGLKLDDFFDGLVDGIKKAIKPAIYMFLAYLVLIIVTYNPFQLHFTKFLVKLTSGLNVITMTIVVMISSIFNIESVYVAQSTLPYVTSVIQDTTLYPLISIIFQSVYGLMMLVAPTSVILIGTLSYLDVSYTQWIKHIWKLFLQLLLVLVVIFFILFLI